MYLVRIYDEECGDLDSATIAASFPSGVCEALCAIGRGKNRTIETTRDGRKLGLTISKNDMVLASLSYEEPTILSAAQGNLNDILKACQDLADDDNRAIASLFISN